MRKLLSKANCTTSWQIIELIIFSGHTPILNRNMWPRLTQWSFNNIDLTFSTCINTSTTNRYWHFQVNKLLKPKVISSEKETRILTLQETRILRLHQEKHQTPTANTPSEYSKWKSLHSTSASKYTTSMSVGAIGPLNRQKSPVPSAHCT